MTQRERIEFLLEQLEDLRVGIFNLGNGGDGVPLTCTAYQHPSVQELERLLRSLRVAEPELSWHLVATHFSPRVRRLVCPSCRAQEHAWRPAGAHRHGRRSFALEPRVVRDVPAGVRRELVAQAVTWLDGHWHGGVFIPDDLLPLVTAA